MKAIDLERLNIERNSNYLAKMRRIRRHCRLHISLQDHTKVGSYRLNISKLFEGILTNKLKPIVNSFDCIPSNQFDFRERHSFIEQTHRTVNIISKKEILFCPIYRCFTSLREGMIWRVVIENIPIFNLKYSQAAWKLFYIHKICS